MASKIEWYDIKTRFKYTIRSIGYSNILRKLLCYLISYYIRLVYYTSRKEFKNYHFLTDPVKQNRPVIMSWWHNCIMMSPTLAIRTQPVNPDYKFYGLASSHGDGRMVGEVLAMFGIHNIFGSSQRSHKAGRGIDLSNFRKIFVALKQGSSVTITPDGPRGPNQKIGGRIIKIAEKSGVPIVPVAYSASHFYELNSWDRFKIPLPFSRICYYFGKPVYIKKGADEQEMNLHLEHEMNSAVEASREMLSSKSHA